MGKILHQFDFFSTFRNLVWDVNLKHYQKLFIYDKYFKSIQTINFRIKHILYFQILRLNLYIIEKRASINLQYLVLYIPLGQFSYSILSIQDSANLNLI